MIASCSSSDAKSSGSTAATSTSTAATTTTTIAVDRAAIDAVLDELLATTKAKRAASREPTLDGLIANYRAAADHERRGALLTSRPVAGVPRDAVAAMSAAFSESARRTDVYVQCGERNPAHPDTACADHFAQMSSASSELALKAAGIVLYGTRRQQDFLAQLSAA